MGGGIGVGLPNLAALMPVVGTGLVAGLSLGWAMPFVSRWLNMPPVGFGYRAVQGAVALGGAWLGRSMRILSPQMASVFAGYGLTFATLGLVQDWQLGVLMPAPAAVPVAAAPEVPAMGYAYEAPYDTFGGYGGAYPGLSYYEAVA